MVASGYACARMTDEAPRPQPTSATRPPAWSLAIDAVESGQPGGDQVRRVAGPEEGVGAGEHVRVMVVPAHPGAGAERVGDAWFGPQRAQRQHERGGQCSDPFGSASANACSSVIE